MTEKQKHIFMQFIPLIYGLIVVLANIFGVFISSGFSTAAMTPDFMQKWHQFTDNSPLWFNSQALTFAVPTVLCICYIRTSSGKFSSKFINLPLMYSLLGISGWGVYLVEQAFFLLYAVKIGHTVAIAKVLLISAMHTFLAVVSTFAFSYFILEGIHRAIVLPLYYPNGRISKIKGVRQPPIAILFLSNYFSVTFFPIAFLAILYFLAKERYSIPTENKTFVVFTLILIMGFVISAFFEKQFQVPLEKLRNRIKKLNDGDFESKVDIIRNDIFGELSDSFNEMTDSIVEKTQKILATQNSVIQGMAIMVESRDNSTGGHIKRTSDCVKVFTDELKRTVANDELPAAYKNVPPVFFDSVVKAAPMHDLGKIAVDDAILRKPGRFTDAEYEVMKTHSKEGARIVENVLADIDDESFKQIAVNVAHYHHEKWDGSGYPEKISGEAIPLEARIMALADVFDALVSKRCYKEEFGFEKAFNIIEESLGTHFDPILGALFLQCRAQLEELYSRDGV